MTSTTCETSVATNLNQTSSSAELASHDGWPTVEEAVAPVVVPDAVEVQNCPGLTVRPVAPEQSSFDGCAMELRQENARKKNENNLNEISVDRLLFLKFLVLIFAFIFFNY